jgi:hypothetical protein
MKFYLLLLFFCPLLIFSQIQIGQDIDGEAADDESGWPVNISNDGSVVAIGARYNDANGVDSGHVRMYENQSGTWIQIGQDINGEAPGDLSGQTVSLSSNGTIVAIGAVYNGGNGEKSGHVRIFENQSGTWMQLGDDIDGEAAFDESGFSVNLSSDGTILAIGAVFNDGNGVDSGHVRIYENQSGTWTQLGQDIDGEAAADRSGQAVSLSSDGTIVAIGVARNDGSAVDAGHTRIYENQSGTWTQIGDDIDGEAMSDSSGWDVSLSSDGTVVAIGSVGNDDNGTNSGHVRVFENQSGTWTQIGQNINGEAANDASGFTVNLSSDASIVAISAIFNDDGGFNSGHVRIYENQSGTWTQIGNDINGETVGDQSGQAVSLSGDGTTIIIGSLVNGNSSGHARVYDLSALLSTDEFELTQFNLYPNPAKDQFTIQLKEGSELKLVNIYNHLAQLISASQETIVNTSKLASGSYIVEVITNLGKATKKLIIE